MEKGIPCQQGSIAGAQRSWENTVCLANDEKLLEIEARVSTFYMGRGESKHF